MKYRKKPIVIEAVQNIPGEQTPVWLWYTTQLGWEIKINTLEGIVIARIGD